MSDVDPHQHGALSSKHSAVYLDTTESTLAQWRYRGDGPPFAGMGRKVVYRVQALDAWLLALEDEARHESGA